MKITSIVLLFALKASTISADGGLSVVKFADAFVDTDASDSPDCADFNIATFGDCVGYCQSEFKSGMSATCPASPGCGTDGGNILSCTCVDNKKNMLWKCKVPPAPPVSTSETCDEGGIITWDDCQDKCKTLAAGVNSGMRVSYTGPKTEVSSCSCQYGYDMTSSYDCKRDKQPYTPKRGVQDCADENIYDAESCNKYCTKNDLVAKAIYSGKGFMKCQCSFKTGGEGLAYQCEVQSQESSYLRSG